MTEPFLGELRPFPTNFAPRGWATCQGQLLSIAQNTALFSILGTTYGGNGQTTFALPNLSGSAPIHSGTGPGLSPYVLGEMAGSETVTLMTTEMPTHTHATNTRNTPTTAVAMTNVPSAGLFVTRFAYHATSTASAWRTAMNPGATVLHPTSVSLAGGGQPHNNQQPYLTILWCICMEGNFPSRN